MAEEAREQSLKEKVEAALEMVRPSLAADGGGVELVEVTEVRLQGACKGCPMAQMTLAMGIGRVLREEVPEVSDIQAVD